MPMKVGWPSALRRTIVASGRAPFDGLEDDGVVRIEFEVSTDGGEQGVGSHVVGVGRQFWEWGGVRRLGLEIGVVLGAGGGSGRIDDTVCQLCTGGNLCVGPENGVEHGGIRPDAGPGADGAGLGHGGRVDGRLGVDGGAESGLAVGIEVGLAGAEIEPAPFVMDRGAEGARAGEFEEGGDDGDFLAAGGRRSRRDGSMQ